LVERDIMWLNIFARLKPRMPLKQTEAALQVKYRPLLETETQSFRNPSKRFREQYLRQRVSLRPDAQGINQQAATWGEPLLLLMGMVGLVLVITCANVAGLLMAKGAARRREIAVRMALGARRGAVVRQLLLESLLLGVVGGLAALLVAVWSSQLLLHLLPEDTTLAANLDARVLAFNIAEHSLTFFQDLEKRLAALPGVTAVGAAHGGPFAGSDRTGNVTVEGYRAHEDENMQCAIDSVSAEYFHTMQVPLLAGRELTTSDGQAAPKVAVVNEQFAKFFFPGGNALGRHLAFGAGDVKLDIEIVGVVRNSYHDSLREKISRFIYIPYVQDNRGKPGSLHYYVRDALNATAFASQIRRAVAELDSNVPAYDLRTVQSQIAESIYSDRLVAWLTSVFGLLATTLAAIGLYGLVAYTVARRT